MVSANRQRGVEYLSLLTRYGIYVVFVILVVAFSLANNRFFTVENLLLILQQASPLGIAVVGMVFVLMVVGNRYLRRTQYVFYFNGCRLPGYDYSNNS